MLSRKEKIITAFNELFDNKQLPVDILIQQIDVNIEKGEITEEEGQVLRDKFVTVIEEDVEEDTITVEDEIEEAEIVE